MVRYDSRSGSLYMTEMGRVASHYYIGHESVVVFNERLKPRMEDADIFYMMALCTEFESLQVCPETPVRLHWRTCPPALGHLLACAGTGTCLPC